MSIAKEKKVSVVKEFQQSKNDTGSCQVQVALLTERINQLTGHMKTHVKDKHSRFGLIHMVERRKRLLAYLASTNPDQYKKVIDRLDLRK